MAATYSYKLMKTSELKHSILASEKEQGVQAFIFRDCRKVKEEFTAHANMVEILYSERPTDAPRDMVFLSITQPCKMFVKYNDEKEKLAMTLGAYMELLKFFCREYNTLINRLDRDIKNMNSRSEWFKLHPYLSFRGPADICYKQTLDVNPKTTLEFFLQKEHKSGVITAHLAYANEKQGSMQLPLAPFLILARDYQTICQLVDYKESGPTKRNHQL